MKVWIKYCMYGAHKLGEHRHPQVAIKATYPDAECFEPQSIADAWFFKAAPLGVQREPFALAPRYHAHEEANCDRSAAVQIETTLDSTPGKGGPG